MSGSKERETNPRCAGFGSGEDPAHPRCAGKKVSAGNHGVSLPGKPSGITPIFHSPPSFQDWQLYIPTPALAARVSPSIVHKSPSASREVTVSNQLGIHARPSAQFVKLASRHVCDVWIEKDDETINGKSIMGLLMLAAGPGSVLRIICSGPGCEEALRELVDLVEGKFGEH